MVLGREQYAEPTGPLGSMAMNHCALKAPMAHYRILPRDHEQQWNDELY